jgi:hypothetical protein
MISDCIKGGGSNAYLVINDRITGRCLAAGDDLVSIASPQLGGSPVGAAGLLRLDRESGNTRYAHLTRTALNGKANPSAALPTPEQQR